MGAMSSSTTEDLPPKCNHHPKDDISKRTFSYNSRIKMRLMIRVLVASPWFYRTPLSREAQSVEQTTAPSPGLSKLRMFWRGRRVAAF